MMELTNGVGLEPGNFVTEVSVKHVEAGLRQCPCVAYVHLEKEQKIISENMQTFARHKREKVELRNLFSLAFPLNIIGNESSNLRFLDSPTVSPFID